MPRIGSNRIRKCSTSHGLGRVGSGRVKRFPNLAGRVGVGQKLFKFHGSGRVGSGHDIFKSHRFGPVVGSRCFSTGRLRSVGSGGVKKSSRIKSGHDP